MCAKPSLEKPIHPPYMHQQDPLKTPEEKDKKTTLLSCQAQERIKHAVHILMCQPQLEKWPEPTNY